MFHCKEGKKLMSIHFYKENKFSRKSMSILNFDTFLIMAKVKTLTKKMLSNQVLLLLFPKP